MKVSAKVLLASFIISVSSCTLSGDEIHHYASIRIENQTDATISEIFLATTIPRNRTPEIRTAYADLLANGVSDYKEIEVETATEALMGNTSWRQISVWTLDYSDGSSRSVELFRYGGGPGDPGSGRLQPEKSYTIRISASGASILE